MFVLRTFVEWVIWYIPNKTPRSTNSSRFVPPRKVPPWPHVMRQPWYLGMSPAAKFGIQACWMLPKSLVLGGVYVQKLIQPYHKYIYIIYVCAIWPSIASVTHGSCSSSGYWGIKIGSSDSGDPRSQFFSSTVTRNRPWKYLMDPQDVTPRLARKPHTYLISSTPQKLFGHSPNPRYLRAKGSGFVWN